MRKNSIFLLGKPRAGHFLTTPCVLRDSRLWPMQPIRTKLAIPKEKCRTPQQKYLIAWYPSPFNLQDQLSKIPCCTEDSGWLLSPPHPRVLLHLGDLS